MSVAEENADASAVAYASLRIAGRVVIEVRPLNERADFERSGECRLRHLVPGLVRP